MQMTAIFLMFMFSNVLFFLAFGCAVRIEEKFDIIIKQLREAPVVKLEVTADDDTFE